MRQRDQDEQDAAAEDLEDVDQDVHVDDQDVLLADRRRHRGVRAEPLEALNEALEDLQERGIRGGRGELEDRGRNLMGLTD